MAGNKSLAFDAGECLLRLGDWFDGSGMERNSTRMDGVQSTRMWFAFAGEAFTVEVRVGL